MIALGREGLRGVFQCDFVFVKLTNESIITELTNRYQILFDFVENVGVLCIGW